MLIKAWVDTAPKVNFQAYAESLAKKGFFSQGGADVLVYLYEKWLAHKKRLMATCYMGVEPSLFLGFVESEIRISIENEENYLVKQLKQWETYSKKNYLPSQAESNEKRTNDLKVRVKEIQALGQPDREKSITEASTIWELTCAETAVR